MNVKLVSIYRSKLTDLGRSAVEHISFADPVNIRKTLDAIIGYKLNPGGGIEAMLRDYAKICSIRHSLVHSAGQLSVRNAVSASIATQKEPLRVNIGFTQFQEMGSVCTGLVIAINVELFACMCRRWALEWRKFDSWQDSERLEAFERIWDCFYSREDAAKGRIDASISMEDCLKQVEAQFGLN